MERKDLLTKTLAVVGTVLVWLPILAPVVFTVARVLTGRLFLFDYLMPAELFPAFLIGGGVLIWAARRAHYHWHLIGWGLGIAVFMLVGGQTLAVVTGLASGETEASGWSWVLVTAFIAVYSLAIVLVGIGGLMLWRDLSRSPRLSP